MAGQMEEGFVLQCCLMRQCWDDLDMSQAVLFR